MTEPVLLRIEECAKLIALGRSKTYALVAQGEIPSIRVGRSVRVPADAVRQWVQRKISEATADAAVVL